jgi:hypothetical protein
MESFLSRDNVDMLVELLLDDKPNKTQTDVNQIIQEINVFRNTQMNSASTLGLLELNQLFITKLVSQQSLHSQQQQQVPQQSLQQQSSYLQQQQPQIPQSTKYKGEDLKAERMDFFDQQLAQKRNEFESAITLKKPPPPVFEDKSPQDTRITDMDSLLAQTLAQRNLDISYSSSQTGSTEWLSPKSTSVKTEKEVKLVIEERTDLDKKISWSDEVIPTVSAILPVATLTTNSFLNKLKPDLETKVALLTDRVNELELKLEQLLNRL